MNKVFAAVLIAIGFTAAAVMSINLDMLKKTSAANEARLQTIIEEQEKLSLAVRGHDETELRNSTEIIKRLTADAAQNKTADARIASLLVEKTKYDYIEKGLEYYDKQNYSQAYNSFSRALNHDPDNTALLFCKIYCLYLSAMKSPVNTNADAYAIIAEGINAIDKNGYKKHELLTFPETFMREMTAYMAVNISGWQRETLFAERNIALDVNQKW